MTPRLDMLPADDREEARRLLAAARHDCPCDARWCTLESSEREAFAEEVARLAQRDRGRGVKAPIRSYVEIALKAMSVDVRGRHRVSP